jgi:hypothetical protein
VLCSALTGDVDGQRNYGFLYQRLKAWSTLGSDDSSSSGGIANFTAQKETGWQGAMSGHEEKQKGIFVHLSTAIRPSIRPPKSNASSIKQAIK